MTPEPISQSELFISRLRSAVKALRYKEISTNSLLSGKEANALGEPDHQISTLNPVSSENVVLRTSLLAGFLKAISYNLNRNEHHLRDRKSTRLNSSHVATSYPVFYLKTKS